MTPRIQRLLVAAAGIPKAPIPEAGRLVWSCFRDLSSSRAYGANGPQPISYEAISAWARMTRTPLRPDHVALLRRMDDAWLEAAFDQIAQARRKDPGGMKILPPASTHAISPDLFDVVT